MKSLLLVSVLFVLSTNRVQATPKIYKASDMFNITLYYEALCPASRGFISGELWKAFQSVGSIMNLNLVPYGNAWQMYVRETNSWKFTCQHGADECWGNSFQACVIQNYPRKEDHFPVIYCIMSYNINIQDAARLCSNKHNIPYNLIENCMSNSQGNDKMHLFADMTERSAHKYVPWITVNGIHTDEIQNKAGNNLIEFVCLSYKGPNKPYACWKYNKF